MARSTVAHQEPHVVIRRYLQDALAAEEHYESQLRMFAADAHRVPELQELLASHAEETRRQIAWLRMRLEILGGEPSGMKAFMAHLSGLVPNLGQFGHVLEERVTHNLITAYAVECSEIAMYEALAVAAAAAGDAETEELARGIQREERRAAEALWNFVHRSAHDALVRVTGIDHTGEVVSGNGASTRHYPHAEYPSGAISPGDAVSQGDPSLPYAAGGPVEAAEGWPRADAGIAPAPGEPISDLRSWAADEPYAETGGAARTATVPGAQVIDDAEVA